MKKYITIALLLFSNSMLIKAQSTVQYPEVGKPMPDFKLTDVNYYAKRKVNLSDFKGKWLVLDFWGAHCSSCIESMPKMSAMQEKFKDKAQIIMVGYSGSQYTKRSEKELIRSRFEITKKDYNLNLVSAYDSLLAPRFDIWTTPYIVIIDPKGIVKGITYKLTEENLNDLMLNRPVDMPKAMRRAERTEFKRMKSANKNGAL